MTTGLPTGTNSNHAWLAQLAAAKLCARRKRTGIVLPEGDHVLNGLANLAGSPVDGGDRARDLKTRRPVLSCPRFAVIPNLYGGQVAAALPSASKIAPTFSRRTFG